MPLHRVVVALAVALALWSPEATIIRSSTAASIQSSTGTSVRTPTGATVRAPAGVDGRAPAQPGASARTLWTGPAGATVYAAPSLGATVLTLLPGNQLLRVTPAGAGWGRTLLWNALPAWAPLASLHARPYVPPARHWQPSSLHPVGPHAPMPLAARAYTREAVYLRAAPAFSAAHLALLPRDAQLAIDAWATDAAGAAWYHATVTPGIGAASAPAQGWPAASSRRLPSGLSRRAAAALTAGRRQASADAPTSGWVYGDAVTFEAGSPAGPAPLAPLRGKGMWFTYALLEHSPVAAIVRAAHAAGLTHLYVEVGRSNAGFYGAPGLAALLPAAHRAGITVIAWVYPFLDDLPADVAMSLAAARYTAPSGDRPDGLLADVETNMDEAAVRAYGQIVRAALGPNRLMAIATYPPQSGPGLAYPFATAALSWNVVVPMDYWHLERRAYSAAEAYRYVADSVRLIHARAGGTTPVEVLGQMFDASQSGVNSPSAAEIAACGRAARDAGALGVSFFEWNHATPEEWGALAALRS